MTIQLLTLANANSLRAPSSLHDGLQIALEPWQDDIRRYHDRSGNLQPSSVEQFTQDFQRVNTWPNFQPFTGGYVRGPVSFDLKKKLTTEFTFYIEFLRRQNSVQLGSISGLTSGDDYIRWDARTSGLRVNMYYRAGSNSATVQLNAPSLANTARLRGIARYKDGRIEAKNDHGPWEGFQIDETFDMGIAQLGGWFTQGGAASGAFYVWDRALSDGEADWLIEAKPYNYSIVERQPLYVPIPTAVPTPDLEADLVDADSITADLTVDIVLQADLADADSITADLTVEIPGDVVLASDLADADSITADLAVEAPGDVQLAADLADADSITADLLVDRPLAADLADTDSITADLSVEIPGVIVLEADLADTDSITADLIVDRALAADISDIDAITATLSFAEEKPVGSLDFRVSAQLTNYRTPIQNTMWRFRKP